MLCSAVRVWALMIGCVSLAMHPGTMLAESDQRLFQVELDETLGVQKRSGRLFVFVTESPTNRPRSSIEWFRPTPFFAIDVSEMEPGHSVDVDESATGFPDKLSTLPDGKYFAHALLHHSLDDGDPGRAQGNYYSESVPFEVVKDKPFNVQLTLKKILPPRTSNESRISFAT